VGCSFKNINTTTFEDAKLSGWQLSDGNSRKVTAKLAGPSIAQGRSEEMTSRLPHRQGRGRQKRVMKALRSVVRSSIRQGCGFRPTVIRVSCRSAKGEIAGLPCRPAKLSHAWTACNESWRLTYPPDGAATLTRRPSLTITKSCVAPAQVALLHSAHLHPPTPQ
jgi:hypothetical protein